MGRSLSIVLVTWNSARYLRRCLEGIAHQTHRAAELIVVDNGSIDESLAMLPADARVIRNADNRGYSAAVNQALAVVTTELVLVVNPDCHLLPEYTERLSAVFNDETIGSATGMLIRAKGYDIEPLDEIDSLGIRMTRTGRHLDIAQGVILSRADGEGPPGETHQPRTMQGVIRPSTRAQDDTGGRFEVFGVSGAAAMFRMSFLRDVQIDGEALDEDFFAYREDADLAWRGRLYGWRAVCEPASVAYHVRRVTPEARRELPPDVNMHSVKNRFLLRLKNQGAYLALRNFPFELVRDLIVLIAALTIERTSLPAFGWLWRNRGRVFAKRREIQRRRKVSDRELARWFR